MQLRNEQLASHLQKNLAPIYLLHGDVLLLQQEAHGLIYQTAKERGFTERQIFQIENGFVWENLLTAIHNLSLFAEQQVLDLRFASGQLGENGSKVLQAYAAQPPADKILLINTDKLDARQQKSAWFMALEKAGVMIQFWPITREQLPQWIMQRFAQKGLQVDRQAAQLLAEQSEGNLLACAQEIEKLYLLYGTARLTINDILNAVSNHARFDVYQLADAALQGDAKRVLKILNGLHAEGCEPTLILWALAREIRTLVNLTYAMSQGIPIDRGLQKEQVWEKRKLLVRKALDRLPAPQLLDLLQTAAQIDKVIKGIAAGNIWNKLERLALRLAGKFHENCI